jgi:hypothetical protein
MDFDSIYMYNALTKNLLQNDLKSSGDSLVIENIIYNNARATISIDNDSTVTYTPHSWYSGVDYFQYEVCKYNAQGSICDTGLVLVHVFVHTNTNHVELKLPTIKLSPQPVQNNFTITFEEKDNQIELIEIINAQGQLIRTISGSHNYEQTCEIGDIPNGIYFIRVNQEITLKFIKI